MRRVSDVPFLLDETNISDCVYLDGEVNMANDLSTVAGQGETSGLGSF